MFLGNFFSKEGLGLGRVVNDTFMVEAQVTVRGIVEGIDLSNIGIMETELGSPMLCMHGFVIYSRTSLN
jgi:hypothetical protein